MATLRYNKKYDSFYNVHTREWAESVCSNPECEYCKDRPEKAPTMTEMIKETKQLIEKAYKEMLEKELAGETNPEFAYFMTKSLARMKAIEIGLEDWKKLLPEKEE